jgi:hypothetical protein
LLLFAGIGCGDEDDDGDGNGGTEARVCVQTCSEAADCGNNAENWNCTDDGLCQFQACTDDAECVPTASGWTAEGCGSNDDCATGVCIEHNETTYCAPGTNDQGECSRDSNQVISRTSADSGEEVDVCGNESFQCNDDNICEDPEAEAPTCESDDDCAGNQVCDDDTCVQCIADADCEGDLSCTDNICTCSGDGQCAEGESCAQRP